MSTRQALAGLFMLLGLLGKGAAEPAAPRILVIESYHPSMSWDKGYKAALEQKLGRRYELVYFALEAKRAPAEVPLRAEQAWAKYLALLPALVVLGDDPAVQHLGKRFAATTTPVVYLGMNNNPRAYPEVWAANNITGVLERPQLKRNLAIVRQLMPAAKRVLVLFDNDLTSRVIEQETFSAGTTTQIEGLTVDLVLTGSWTRWQEYVLNARQHGYDAICVGPYWSLSGADGRNVDGEEQVIGWTSAHAPLPLFAFWEVAVGAERAIGGLVIRAHAQGGEAADMALAILSGRAPRDILPRTAERGRFIFSRGQLARWGLSLPAQIAAQASMAD